MMDQKSAFFENKNVLNSSWSCDAFSRIRTFLLSEIAYSEKLSQHQHPLSTTNDHPDPPPVPTITHHHLTNTTTVCTIRPGGHQNTIPGSSGHISGGFENKNTCIRGGGV